MRRLIASHRFCRNQRIHDSRGCGGLHAKQGHRRLVNALAMLRNQPASAANKEKACRAYAASLYQSVTLRQVAASSGDGERYLALLDSTINAFNDLLATKCGS